MRYDPTAAPDPLTWLGASEGDRLDSVLQQHKRARERAGNLRMHAAIHVTVEIQLAEGLEPTVRAMERLLEQGLARHDALHAIGSVVAEQMVAAVQGGSFDAAGYAARLDALTAASWRSSGHEG